MTTKPETENPTPPGPAGPPHATAASTADTFITDPAAGATVDRLRARVAELGSLLAAESARVAELEGLVRGITLAAEDRDGDDPTLMTAAGALVDRYGMGEYGVLLDDDPRTVAQVVLRAALDL